MLDINITALYQIIGYLIFLAIIHRFLATPVLRILKERDARTNGTRKEAEKIESDVQASVKEYETRLKEATLKGMEHRGKLKQAALEEEQAVIEAARKEANSYLNEIKGEIASGKESSLLELKGQTRVFSKEIAEKVLSRKVLSVLALLAPVALLLIPGIVFASSGGHEEGSSSGLIWKWINFTILVVALYFVWTKVIKGLLNTQIKGVEVAIKEAEELKKSALAKESEYNEKLKLFDAKIAEIQSDLKRDGEAEKIRIMKEADEAAIRIKEQARALVDQEVDKAKAEIRREVALLSIDMAKTILEKEFNDDDQRRLVAESLKKVRLH